MINRIFTTIAILCFAISTSGQVNTESTAKSKEKIFASLNNLFKKAAGQTYTTGVGSLQSTIKIKAQQFSEQNIVLQYYKEDGIEWVSRATNILWETAYGFNFRSHMKGNENLSALTFELENDATVESFKADKVRDDDAGKNNSLYIFYLTADKDKVQSLLDQLGSLFGKME